MGIGRLLWAIYQAANFARKTPVGSTIVKWGVQGLAIKEIADALDSFFGADGPGANVNPKQSKQMKEAVTYLMTQVPEGFRGPWEHKGISYNPKYMVIDMEKDRVFLTTKYISSKAASFSYKKGKEHGENKAKKEINQQNQLAKGSK